MAVKKSIKPTAKRISQKHVPAAAKTTAGASGGTEYAIGDRISQPMFGHGTVAAIDADKLTIEFEGNVVKQILDGYVKPRRA